MQPGKWHLLAWASAAVAAFHLAYEFRPLAFLMAVFLFCMLQLARANTPRTAFWTGFGVGFACYAPHLAFFWGIFGYSALSFWLLLSFFPAIFLLVLRWLLAAWPRHWLIAAPFLWTGIEYLRSELTYLRFSWLIPGYAFAGASPLRWLGIYGLSFVLMAFSAVVTALPRKFAVVAGLILLGLVAGAVNLRPADPSVQSPGPVIAGIQLELPAGDDEVVKALDNALARRPDANVFILSEYTFGSFPPQAVLDWCNRNSRYIIVGGMHRFGEDTNAYYDTAFVIDLHGRIVFEQAKSVPIQFMIDGQPAEKQSLWDSPWGKIGLCVCYDLSYRRVMDRLVDLGAQAIIVPSMDLTSWGAHEHYVHSLVGPTRAAEYGLPIVRVCSSGISQIVAANGAVTASAPYPGQREIIAGQLMFAGPGHVPLDRFLTPACVAVSVGCCLLLLAQALRAWRRRSRGHSPAP